MAFDNATFPRPGIGIHGYTGENGGMGRQVSNGCVRMLNDQVVELFHTLASPERAPTVVEVVEEPAVRRLVA
jgi:lipoprotein-anchoring transpeptidase ErfK/SrfK